MEDNLLDDLWNKLIVVVKAHLWSDDEDAKWLAERLISRGVLNGFAFNVFDQPRDKAALQRVENALAEIERALSDVSITHAARNALGASLVFGPSWQSNLASAEEKLAYIEKHGSKNLEAFNLISENTNDFRRAVKATMAHLETSPLSKRTLTLINSEGIGIVEACRWIWKLTKGRDAPSKDLNPASKFAAFLADVMDACEISGDPRSTFLAWARLQNSP